MNNNRTEIIIKQREREKLLEELTTLEKQESNNWWKIFWNCFTLLIINPLIATITGFWLAKQMEGMAFWMGAGGSQVKWSCIFIALAFLFNSLALLFYLYQMADLKSKMAQVKRNLYRLEIELKEIIRE